MRSCSHDYESPAGNGSQQDHDDDNYPLPYDELCQKNLEVSVNMDSIKY